MPFNLTIHLIAVNSSHQRHPPRTTHDDAITSHPNHWDRQNLSKHPILHDHTSIRARFDNATARHHNTAHAVYTAEDRTDALDIQT